MKAFRRSLSLLLTLLLLFSLPAAALAVGEPEPYALRVRVGDKEAPVRAYEESYAGNVYLSMSDLALALKGTDKQFKISYSVQDGGQFLIATGQAAAGESLAKDLQEQRLPLYLNLQRNRLFVDGQERKLYSYRAGSELYMSLADVQLTLDLNARLQPDGSLALDVDAPLQVDLEALRRSGYFDMFNAVVLGDADSGRVLFTHMGGRSFPVASLSKLMSYLLLAEARDRGELSFSDTVTVSDAAARLSRSVDGMIFLSPGAELPFQELLNGMLLASSNECALALAEHACGSEAAFVERMNQRARELGLLSAVFYSPHGLPVYAGESLPVKQQNSMSAKDMFTLSAYVLRSYPEITDITSLPYCRMEKLEYTTANSNPLVFNLPGCNGLKTGSTNRAGYCLSATLPVESQGRVHTVLLVLLGAESAELRGQAAELLLRYAQDYYIENGFTD